MLLVTGGAGFIGSNVVARLNEAGRTDVVVNDWLGASGKWHNLQKRQLADVVDPADLLRWLDGRKLDAVIHLGQVLHRAAHQVDHERIALRFLLGVQRVVIRVDSVVHGLLPGIPLDSSGTPFMLDPATGAITVSQQSKLFPLPGQIQAPQ